MSAGEKGCPAWAAGRPQRRPGGRGVKQPSERSVPRLLLVLMLFVVVCAPGVPASGGAAGAVKNPEIYVHAATGDPDTLDYAFAWDIPSSTTIANIYETLVDFDGVHTDRFVPLLATAVPSMRNGLISADGRTYTFPIRQGVRFHDGTLMTADDVAYSLRRFLLIGAPVASLLLEPFFGIYQVQDDRGNPLITSVGLQRAIRVQGASVVLTLQEPFGAFISLLAGFSFVVSRRWAAANGDWDGTASTIHKYINARLGTTPFHAKANGTGAFRLERWDRSNGEVVLVRNDAYWRTPPRLTRVIVKTVPDTATRILMLKAGDADSISIGQRDLPHVEGAAGIRVIDRLRQNTIVGAVMWFVSEVETQGSPYVGSGRLDGQGVPGDFFADVHVRRAFGYAFDYASFIDAAYRGKALPARGMFPEGMTGYSARQDYFTFNPERAKEEFRAAFNGALWERGFRLSVVYSTGSNEREVLAHILKQSIESLNPKFAVDVRSLLWSSYLSELRRHRLPLFLTGFFADYPDPHNFAYGFLHSASMNFQRFRTPADVDRLIISALRETNPRRREELYFEVNRKYFELAPSIVLANPLGVRVQRTWVRGWYFNPARFFRYYPIWKE